MDKDMDKEKDAAPIPVAVGGEGEVTIVQKGEGSEKVFEHRLKDTSPSSAKTLRRALSSCHWATATQILDVISWVVPTDRQWEMARKKVLALVNDQDNQMGLLVNQIVKEKDKE